MNGPERTRSRRRRIEERAASSQLTSGCALTGFTELSVKRNRSQHLATIATFRQTAAALIPLETAPVPPE